MLPRAPFDAIPACTIPRPEPACRRPLLSRVVPYTPGSSRTSWVSSRPFSGNSRIRRTSMTSFKVADERRIRELPLNGRDATQLVLLLPGVYGTVRDNSGLRQAGSGRGIVQAGIASNGARSNMINYMLDGTTHNDTYTNVALAFPNPDALQEFSVQTNNFSAESGRSAGAVVTAVTRSGSNTFHGSLS